MNPFSQRGKTLSIFAFLSALEGVVALIYLLRIPGDMQNVWLIGLSKTRFALAAVLLVGIAVFVLVAFTVWRKPQTLTHLQSLAQRGEFYYPTVFFFLLGGVIAGHLLWLSGTLTDEFLHGVLTRLVPLIAWGGVMSWQLLLILPLLRYEGRLTWSASQKSVFWLGAGVFATLLALWGIIAYTGFGITPDVMGWDAPGAPVMAWQGWLAWLLGLLFLLVERILARGGTDARARGWFDLVMSVLLFVAAYTLWSSAPMERAYYAPMERAPNYELYPYSDAALYDSGAQRVLLGEGFGGVTRKPLYVIFLVLAHALVGNEYDAVTNIQVLLLALMPVIVYWLTQSLHTRFSGVIAALLLILRERNAIALSADIRIVHSKILMSDLPVGFGILLFTWLMVVWLRDPAKRRWMPVLAGGVFGLSMLIRSNSVIMLAAILVVFMIVFLGRFYHKDTKDTGNNDKAIQRDFSVQRKKTLLRASVVMLSPLMNALLLFFLGLGLAIAPWVWRSYQITGRASFNETGQVAYHAELYTEPENVGKFKLPQLPGESGKNYLDRLNKHVVDYTLANPGVVAGFVIPHTLHNQIGMLLTLPLSPWLGQDPNMVAFNYKIGDWPSLWEDCCGVRNYVQAMPVWEAGWAGALSTGIKLMLTFNLMLVSLGLAAAWKKLDLVGWIPLVMALAYSLSTAVARFSGWRFSLPVDWAGYIYFSIGLGQLSLWAVAWLFRSPAADEAFPASESTWQRVQQIEPDFGAPLRPALLSAVVVLGIGLAPLIVEKAISPQDAPLPQVESIAAFEAAGFNAFPSGEGAIILQGRAFYPRYYLAGEGESGSGWEAYRPRDYDRLGFTLIGTGDVQVILPLDEIPTYLPNGSDVLIAGCETSDVVYAAAVLIWDETQHLLAAPPSSESVCPAP
ncbi:MAG: glycosyltransferase family 39 protein [Anaerolineae bacterium]|nr:glycosyltransferase family 39 protein [Anaerolineae bacterium]